jgi:hypothetical protein
VTPDVAFRSSLRNSKTFPGSVETTARVVAEAGDIAPETMSSIMDGQLDEMVRFSIDELRNDREPAPGRSAEPRQTVAVELF